MSANDDVFPDQPPPRVSRIAKPSAAPCDYDDATVRANAQRLMAVTVARMEIDPEPTECVAPSAAKVGEYAHRLAVASITLPHHGDHVDAMGKGWEWDMAANAWRRTA